MVMLIWTLEEAFAGTKCGQRNVMALALQEQWNQDPNVVCKSTVREMNRIEVNSMPFADHRCGRERYWECRRIDFSDERTRLTSAERQARISLVSH